MADPDHRLLLKHEVLMVMSLYSCCDVTELECSDWTGEDASAAGDKFIHDRDLDWLRQSDGEDQ